MRLMLCWFVLCALTFADEKPTLEQKIKDSTPLKLEARELKKAGAVLQVTPIMMEKPFLSDWFADGPRYLKVEGDKLESLFNHRGGKQSLHCFKLPTEGGKLSYDKDIEDFDRKTHPWRPREEIPDWGDDIVSRPVGQFVGKPDKEEEKEKGHQLRLEETDGKVVRKLGFVEEGNSLCWLHNFCSYKKLVFLVDGNCRKIGVWTIEGTHLFNIECRELGLDYPWVQSIDITDKGELYLGFTQKRKNADGKKNSSIQEAAFLKITGLDTIR